MTFQNSTELLGDLEYAIESASNTPRESSFNFTMLSARPDSLESGEEIRDSLGGSLLHHLDGISEDAATKHSPRTAHSLNTSTSRSGQSPRIPQLAQQGRSCSPSSQRGGMEGAELRVDYRSRSHSPLQEYTHDHEVSHAQTSGFPSQQSKYINDSVAALCLSDNSANVVVSSPPTIKMRTYTITAASRYALAANNWEALDIIRGNSNAKIHLDLNSNGNGSYRITVVSNMMEKTLLGWELIKQFCEEHEFAI